MILTYNSESTLHLVVRSVLPLNPRIVVVDSFSTDGTVDEARKLGCEIFEHAFEDYAHQRNWAQDKLELKSGWILHLDSDETLSPELRSEIGQVISNDPPCEGFIMRRRPFFMGRPICHGTIATTWHLRLFRAGHGRCEGRLYDQHYLCDGRYGKLRGQLLDLQLISIESWTASHNRWSSAEAQQALIESEGSDLLPARFFGDPRMRRRWLKTHVWYRTPLFIRPLLFFIYSYVFKLGFLDGRHGIVYHVLQTFWFRFLVDAKLLEKRQAMKWKTELIESLEEGF